jgi:ligand-binding SRPBCC domain-containing protein
MKIYTLQQKQFLPISLSAAWEFFSDPHNLKRITPPSMGFRILSETPNTVYAGMIICYTVTPLFGIPVRWVTEITHVEEQHYFVDNQRFGPYTLWHHQHLFKEVQGGVEMNDIIHYALPFGIIGSIARELVVRNQLTKIFSYRRIVMESLFPVKDSLPSP